MSADDHASNERGRGHLLRILGVAFGLAVVVGGVVGQGILRTPGIVAGSVSDPALILLLWTLGGMMILIDACSWVELGASVPRSGGPYALARRAFGNVGGNVIGWADWLNCILVLSFISVVFGEYCHRLGIAPDWPVGAISLVLIAACAAINWTGTRISGASQTLLSALKGFAIVILVVLLFLFGGGDADAPPAAAAAAAASPAASSTLGWAALLVAMSAIMNTYGGWTGSVYFGEEIVAPERNMARSTFGGILLVMALYLAVNASLLHVLTPAEMARSDLPAADAASHVFGSAAATVITLVSLASLGAIANLYAMFISRIGFAMARDGVLPMMLARTSRSGTPRLALAVGTIVAAGAALSGTYLELVAVVVPMTAGIVATIDFAAIVMRRKEPNLPRPFKMPLYPLPAIVGIALNLSLMVALVIADPWHAMIGIGAAVVLGIGYALFDRRSAPLRPGPQT